MTDIIKKDKISFDVNILIKKEDGMFVAHCLELDIVAVGPTMDAAQQEVVDLVVAQVSYAFNNDNLEHLYHPAPKEVWEEFYRCKERTERRYPVQSDLDELVPPWLLAKTCAIDNHCHV